jgi:hypothetical protein
MAFLLSIAALRADDLRPSPIPDGDVVPQEMAKGHMMPAVKAKFPAFEFGETFLQLFRILVDFRLPSGHNLPPETQKSPSWTNRERLCLLVDSRVF